MSSLQLILLRSGFIFGFCSFFFYVSYGEAITFAFLRPPNDGASAAPQLRPTLILAENGKPHFSDSHSAPWASAASAGWTGERFLLLRSAES